MFSRPMLFLGVLAAAVGVPFVLLDEGLSKTARTQFARITGKPAAAEAQTAGTTDAVEAGIPPLSLPQMKPASPTAAVPVPLEEALNFNLTPEYVAARWPRVSTVLGDAGSMGLRVALVSGTRPDDVAGSLTYYFDDRHRLKRITLVGVTGDETRLVRFAMARFGLRPVATLAAGMYAVGDPAKPTSKLEVKHLPVVRAEATHARTEVALDVIQADALESPDDRQDFVPGSYRRW